MCIIVVKPPLVHLKKAILKTCYDNNPHGAGFAYPERDGSKVVIEKGFFSFKSFWKAYRNIQYMQLPMLIHFRVATSGKIDKDNCHPWRIDNNHAMVHNGVLSNIGKNSESCSDTGIFVNDILIPLFESNQEFWKENGFKWLIESSIKKSNKIAIINNYGDYEIFNEQEGEWEHGAWFSNSTFKESRKKTSEVVELNGVKYLKRIKNGVSSFIKVDAAIQIDEQTSTQQLLLPPSKTNGTSSLRSYLTRSLVGESVCINHNLK